MSFLSLSSITKSYHEPHAGQVLPVLNQLDLQMESGESVAIVGRSGCGKSTLLNVLGLLDVPDAGEYTLAGEPMAQASAEQRAAVRSGQIGFIFQLHHLLPQCTALENVLLPTLARAKRDKGQLRQRALDLLAAVGLSERVLHRPAQLSGGERQRVAVARALIHQPSLILADEPTGALDEEHAQQLTELLLGLQKQTGAALILVTHHLHQAAQMQRVLKLQGGKLTS
jgi:lipoprotein-releasing system ATP-binding protein